MKTTGKADRFDWRLPLYAAFGTFIFFVPVSIWTSESLFYLIVVTPIVSCTFGIFFVAYAIDKKPRRCLSMVLALVIYWVISAALFVNYSSIRSAARWHLWSNRYKASVLAQPYSANGEFKHIDWDGWGFPGAGNTEIYLVFDPTDSLAAAAKVHKPGKFNGIPCDVFRVSRLEDHWYAALFYTGYRWGEPEGDCGVKADRLPR